MQGLQPVKVKLSCLLANDDLCQAFMMETILKFLDIKVLTTPNGFEALQAADKSFTYI